MTQGRCAHLPLLRLQVRPARHRDRPGQTRALARDRGYPRVRQEEDAVIEGLITHGPTFEARPVMGPTYPRRSSTTTGMTRVVRRCYSAKFGLVAARCANSRSRSAPSVTLAHASNVSPPTSTVTAGCASRLWYHAGWVGDPPFEATMT
jgi:hypothetical protein